MRRATTTIAASLMMLVLTALPAFATETAVAAEPSLFYGLQVTAIVAIVVGLLLFFDANAMGPNLEDEHDHADHGH